MYTTNNVTFQLTTLKNNKINVKNKIPVNCEYLASHKQNMIKSVYCLSGCLYKFMLTNPVITFGEVVSLNIYQHLV